jgi:pimeloyl-ACP methyl ester carboxylesterase
MARSGLDPTGGAGVRLAAALALLALAGCGMRTLRQNLEVVHEQASVEGAATISSGALQPIVVVAEQAGSGKIADIFVLARPGPFFFTLPAGRYRLAAFADTSRDLTYQPGEPAALLGPTGEITLAEGERKRGVELTIDPGAGVVLPFAVNASLRAGAGTKMPALQIGTITTLDDPRFSAENGELGLWNPVRFMFDVGGGIYFLEEYDPKKIPVLFVHGATGSPANWRYLAGTIDRSRFQPWFAYYPAAPHLGRVGDVIVRALSSLQFRYRFDRLVLIAHSMGGLVTRDALDYVMRNQGPGRVVSVPLFLSISSPWGGVSSASLGVKYAPVVAPMWEDMAPGSAFLTALPKTALPPETEYDLFFSYRSASTLSAEANDGTVTVASELSMPIQRQAVHVMGFDETHTSILESADVAQEMNSFLARIPR